MDQYLGASLFLADINNEVAARRRQRYAANLSSLRRLVLFLFEQDDMGEGRACLVGKEESGRVGSGGLGG